MSEDLIKKMLEQFIEAIGKFNDNQIRLQESVNRLLDAERDVANELRELRREFAALAAKLELAIQRR